MDIIKELQPYAADIEAIASSGKGRCIGTGLADDMELAMQKVLPNTIGYEFLFDMRGNCNHVFYEKVNPANFIKL